MSKAREEAAKIYKTYTEVPFLFKDKNKMDLIGKLLNELELYQKITAKAAEFIRLSHSNSSTEGDQLVSWHEYGEAQAELVLSQIGDSNENSNK